MSLQVQARAFSTVRVADTHSLFNTTSATFVDVTGALGISLPDGFTTFVKSDNRATAGGNALAQSIDTGAGTVSSTNTTTSSTFVRLIGGTAINNTGAPVSMKLQARQQSGTATEIDVDSYLTVGAPLNNITDLFFKVSVKKFRFMTTGAGDGIFGKQPSASQEDFAEFDVDQLVNAFIWSANGGGVLYDYTGNSIEVIP